MAKPVAAELKGISRIGHTTNVRAGVDTVYPGQHCKKWKTGEVQATSGRLAELVKTPIDYLVFSDPPAWRNVATTVAFDPV